ncbi:hypothetical protein [Pedobacter sp. ASV12]|uniref:hypothetical protein n=1 Tax=Pedobacter sp. ASV12 TaxID=2795120 RepID=UPI0018ECC1EA|nr:hypothetical protein [Pedobacter sp. ASV12]
MDLFSPEIGLTVYQLFMAAVLVLPIVFLVRYFRRKNRILKMREQELKANQK